MEEQKRCRDCGAVKPLEEFPLQKGGKQGRHPLCKPCRAAQERARYDRDRERLLEGMRVDPERPARTRRQALRRKYGLTFEEFDAMRVRHRSCCAICEVRAASLLVDHDHRTGDVRGLLCSNCNFGIGDFADDPELCLRAARYLEGQPKDVRP